MISAPKMSVSIMLMKKEYFIGQFRDARQALFPKQPPVQPMSFKRRLLDAVFAFYPFKHLEPFPRAVHYVNTNLASHGNDGIGLDGIFDYIASIHRVQAGELSNSSAFILASFRWSKKGQATGAAFNFLGFFVAGTHDHKKRALGIRAPDEHGLSASSPSKPPFKGARKRG